MPQPLPRPDDPTARRLAALASGEPRQVLAAAGAFLRESDTEQHAEAEEALVSLAIDEVRVALAAIDPAACGAAIGRACEEAFEAGLIGAGVGEDEEDEDERDAHAASAIEALAERDEVESTLVAVDVVVAHAASIPEATSLREVASSLRHALAAVDAAGRARCRALSAVNPERRERAAVLAPEHRAASWWWTEGADEADDGLVEALAGRPEGAGARALVDAGRAALTPRTDVLGAALRRADEPAAEDSPVMRLARAEADRSEAAAIALRLARELSVDERDDVEA